MLKQFIILALAVVVTANASPSNEQWYFGYDSGSNIVVFNIEGDTRLILEHIGDREFSHHRLGPAAALFTLTRNHKAKGLYYLTSEAAVKLEGAVDLTLLDAQGFDILAYQHPYVVIKPNGCRFYCEWSMPVWLANLDTGHLEEIAPYVFIGSPQPLGIEGHFLRYAARSAPNVLRWELLERDLSTDEVRAFYSFSNERPSSLRASPTGAYWLYSYPTIITAGEKPASFSLLLRSDGSVEMLENTPENGIRKFGWEMFDDKVMKWPLDCQTDCWLELYPVDAGSAQRFLLPEPGYTEVVRRIDENRVLVKQRNVFWLLHDSGNNLPLGMNKDGASKLLSPDGQWLFTVEDSVVLPTTFHLWDLHHEHIALKGLIKYGFTLDFFERGILIKEFPLGEGSSPHYIMRSQELPTNILEHFSEGNSPYYTQRLEENPTDTLYRFSDSTVLKLPSDAFYFDVLPDGKMLASRYRDGIYLVNPETGEERLLLAGVQALPLDA